LHQRHAILDGNVKRVLARHRAIAGWPGQSAVAEQLWQAAETYTPAQRIADYNQAMMDLGATVCVRTPRCEACPVTADCTARLLDQVKNFPGAKPRRTLPVRATVMPMLLTESGAVLLERRPPQGIWGGLLSFPELAADDDIVAWCRAQFGVRTLQRQAWPVLRHTFSHYHLDITPVALRVEDCGDRIMESTRWVWYKEGPVPGGLAAPVKQSLKRLLEPAGWSHDSNSSVRQAG
jgi:A/G-specific adenine glycosylase